MKVKNLKKEIFRLISFLKINDIMIHIPLKIKHIKESENTEELIREWEGTLNSLKEIKDFFS